MVSIIFFTRFLPLNFANSRLSQRRFIIYLLSMAEDKSAALVNILFVSCDPQASEFDFT